ncbi:uncharacterized protein LOC120391410 [Mauremys reevesii]|uniref:uncharacterized protein LOC120391410 n=1 Tax=Mauremys reevesii TaxID=260615 RepID=UPI00193F153D|nr:uncharacterized protein LOC120391410 [Mauremys reevesii]
MKNVLDRQPEAHQLIPRFIMLLGKDICQRHMNVLSCADHIKPGDSARDYLLKRIALRFLAGEIQPATNPRVEVSRHVTPDFLMAVDLNQRELWNDTFEGLDSNLLAMSTNLVNQAVQDEGLTVEDASEHWIVCQQMMKGGSQVEELKPRVPFVEAITYSDESIYRSGYHERGRGHGRGQNTPPQGGRGWNNQNEPQKGVHVIWNIAWRVSALEPRVVGGPRFLYRPQFALHRERSDPGVPLQGRSSDQALEGKGCFSPMVSWRYDRSFT